MDENKEGGVKMIPNSFSFIIGCILVFFSSWPVREDLDRKIVMLLMLWLGMEYIRKGFGG